MARPLALPPASSDHKVSPAPFSGVPDRFEVLDGFRAVSILSVLACHMLPLGPSFLRLNQTFGLFGMALFFGLSGFLITTTLEKHRNIAEFMVRRLCRILPLAYLYSVPVCLLLGGFQGKPLLTHLLFTVNYSGTAFEQFTTHFWSLCVEIHFYLFIGLAALLTRFRLSIVIPVALACILGARVWYGVGMHVVTHFRADEILAGSLMALVWMGRYGEFPKRLLSCANHWLLLLLLLIACHPASGPMVYLRGVIASVLIGSSLAMPDCRMRRLLSLPILAYLARVSYAVYIIHPLTMHGWLGSGSPWIKYLKRPLCFALTFTAAHFSTFYYERWWLDRAKTLVRRRRLHSILVVRAKANGITSMFNLDKARLGLDQIHRGLVDLGTTGRPEPYFAEPKSFKRHTDP